MDETTTLSDRLVDALEASNMRKIDLARKIGVSPQVIHRLCNSKTHTTRFAQSLADALDVNLKWLTTGEGPRDINDNINERFLREYTIVPLIEKLEINDYLQLDPLSQLTKTDHYFVARHGIETALAITVPDASMEPSLKKKSVIVIDTEFHELKSSDIALIYIEKCDEYLIREFSNDGTKESPMFVPHNTEMYKSISAADAIIIGKVIGNYWEDISHGDPQ